MGSHAPPAYPVSSSSSRRAAASGSSPSLHEASGQAELHPLERRAVLAHEHHLARARQREDNGGVGALENVVGVLDRPARQAEPVGAQGEVRGLEQSLAAEALPGRVVSQRRRLRRAPAAGSRRRRCGPSRGRTLPLGPRSRGRPARARGSRRSRRPAKRRPNFTVRSSSSGSKRAELRSSTRRSGGEARSASRSLLGLRGKAASTPTCSAVSEILLRNSRSSTAASTFRATEPPSLEGIAHTF